MEDLKTCACDVQHQDVDLEQPNVPDPTVSSKEENGCTPDSQNVAQFAIVELMGHVRLAGRISEVEMYGTKMGRIDIFDGEDYITQFFSGHSVYRITPCSEEIARAMGKESPAPVEPWRLKPLLEPLPVPTETESNWPFDEAYEA